MKYLLRITTGLVAFLSAFLALGQSTDKTESSLLWEISGKGMTKPSYLFGTIHMICPTDYFWTDAMEQSLDKTDKLCLEMDLDNTSAMMESMSALLDPGTKLSTYFSQAQYSKLSKYAEDSLGMGSELIQYMKPVTLLMLMSKQSASLCEAPVSYEEQIMKAAKKSKKEVLGLESVTEQITALETIPADSVVKYVMESIEGTTDTDDGSDEYNELILAYKHQDIGSLHTMIAKSEGLGGATNALLDDRNKKWISRMTGMMDSNSVFFAVGAGHLAGGNGVINLLKKRGYKVIPVK